MSHIHQMYCTHCTFGTSALERRTGTVSDRVLGYSARASSLEQDELRKAFRQIERYLYYALPSDAPSEEKLRLNADSAPRRLIYLPSVGGWQVLGQVSYRQFDTSNRVGSYFGHFLLAERNNHPWSVLDCLKLWGALWTDEDSADIPFKLSPLPTLGHLCGDKRPAIDDNVLLSFLTTEPGEPFDDPCQTITQRWRNTTCADRTAVLIELLRAYLDLGDDRRANVLAVVEPSVAALLFYGVARLLPAGELRDELSFSTFEPVADRVPTLLGATVFHDPLTMDLKPESYRRAGRVMNTFLRRSSVVPSRLSGHFAQLVVNTLIVRGPEALDNLLDDFQSALPKRAEDLELLAEANDSVPALLQPLETVRESQWNGSALATRFLGAAVHNALADEPPTSPRWKQLAEGPNAMLLLNLAASAASERQRPNSLARLLRHLPADRLPELLASQAVALDSKADAVASHIKRTGHLPDDCGQLWNENADGPAGSTDGLLAAVLTRLDLETLQRLSSEIPESCTPQFLVGMAKAGSADMKKQPHVIRLIAGTSDATGLNDDQLADLLIHYGDELRNVYPVREANIARRLWGLFKILPNAPLEFSKRLDMLRAWVEFFGDTREADKQLDNWERLRREFQNIANAAAQANGTNKRKPSPGYDFRNCAVRLAVVVDQAMSEKFFGTDPHGERRIECLSDLSNAFLGRRDFLPNATWVAIRAHFDNRVAGATQLKPLPRSKYSTKRRNVTTFAALALITVVLVVAIIILLSKSTLFRSGHQKSPSPTENLKSDGQDNPPPASTVPPVAVDKDGDRVDDANKSLGEQPPPAPSNPGSGESTSAPPNTGTTPAAEKTENTRAKPPSGAQTALAPAMRPQQQPGANPKSTTSSLSSIGPLKVSCNFAPPVSGTTSHRASLNWGTRR